MFKAYMIANPWSAEWSFNVTDYIYNLLANRLKNAGEYLRNRWEEFCTVSD